MSEDWFILRTSGRFTLQLAATLADDGYEVWTPAKKQTIRIPRKNVKREIRLPMLPSFIFARSRHLVDLLELANLSVKPINVQRTRGDGEPRAHRDFSVFHYLDQIPMVADRHLEPLREEERRAIPKKERPRFDRGQNVRVNSGAFQGLIGKVERYKSGNVLVIFGDHRRPVQIPTFLLVEDDVDSPDRPSAIAA